VCAFAYCACVCASIARVCFARVHVYFTGVCARMLGLGLGLCVWRARVCVCVWRARTFVCIARVCLCISRVWMCIVRVCVLRVARVCV
jgi:hypothetical protein